MHYADTVLPVMRETREILLRGFGKARAVNQKTDSAWSIVTQIDLDVERAVRDTLAKKFSDIEFVGEEAGGDRTRETFWLMDPIDGTAAYARGLPFCTSMLALVDKSQVTFGAVYDFLNDSMYWAERGQGAFCNDARLQVSSRDLKNAMVSFETRIEVQANAALHERLRQKTGLMKSFSAGWEFAMVAAGRIEGRICLDPYGADYDFAPGTLLVSEAGGVVRNISSNEYDYRNLNFIASNKEIYSELTEGRGALFPLR